MGNLSFLNQAISTRAQLPILSGFLLIAEKGKLKILATDLEIGISVSIPASIEEEGRLVVLAKPFSEFVASLSEEKITIEKKENTILISGKKTRASFVFMDESEFPNLFEEKGEEIITIDGEAIVKNFSRVVFAASQDAGRPAFAGVLLKQEKEKVLMVATDSHRLSKNLSRFVKQKANLKTPLLISARTIRTLLANKSEDDVVVSVSQKQNQIIFSQGETILVGRLIDAEYPDFEKIIPTDSTTRAEFDRVELQNALKTASVFARDNANIAKLSIKKDVISVWAKSQSLGENSVDVAAKTTGEGNEIAFNIRYVLDLLQNIDAETMVFEMTGPLNPGVFKIANDNSFIHLIMPVRVKDEELQG